MYDLAPPPVHPQPGFFEEVVKDLNIDPSEIPPTRTHEEFMADHKKDWARTEKKLPKVGGRPKATANRKKEKNNG